MDYNQLVPEKIRFRLNSQKNKMKLEGRYAPDGTILQPYRYVIGLGERHFRLFQDEVERICGQFPWMRKKHVRFILHELVLNTQFSMLREIVKNVPEKRKTAGYFHVTIFPCESFFAASIEEFGDFFDYYGYISRFSTEPYSETMYDEMEESMVSLHELAEDTVKLVLDPEGALIVPDGSNQLGLNIIEKATDYDFYVTSFYKQKKYMWKRIYFRVENDTAVTC